jgi:hypothetical protein
MGFYLSESLYLAETTDLCERLARIDQVILALENQAIISAGDSNIADYSLNDGQVTIRTAYRSPEAIANAILAFDRIRARLSARLCGNRVVTLRGANSFNNRVNL